MKRFFILPFVSIALLLGGGQIVVAQQRDQPYSPPRHRGQYGSGPGDVRPRAPKIEEEKEPVATPLDEQWKWLLAVFVVVLVIYTTWRLLSESAKVRPRDKRQPWEFE